MLVVSDVRVPRLGEVKSENSPVHRWITNEDENGEKKRLFTGGRGRKLNGDGTPYAINPFETDLHAV